MFKEVGIFVRDNLMQSADKSALESMIRSISNQNVGIYIDEMSQYLSLIHI